MGRARPLAHAAGSALGLPLGAVVDLDRPADSPVDLYVNGMRFAHGQLIVTEDGEWAVSLSELESEGLRMLDLARPAQACEAHRTPTRPMLNLSIPSPITRQRTGSRPNTRPPNPRSD